MAYFHNRIVDFKKESKNVTVGGIRWNLHVMA